MDTGTVRIYSTEDSPRLRYIAAVIMGDILGLPWEITTDKRKIRKRPVINYSNENIAGSFRIIPDTLLFETGIRTKEIQVTTWNGLPVFFQAAADADFPFDIFAASFYMISRYEEYSDDQPDEHGRYKASSSIAYKNGFLGIPVVDLWVKEMARYFIKKFRNIAVKRNEYRALLTIDADQPFKYPGKNVFKSIGGFVNDLANHTGRISKRYKTISRSGKDPYDVFDYITTTTLKTQSDIKFFFPVGDHSEYDKNPSWKNTAYRKLITGISSKFGTGLHPSYRSAFRQEIINAEKERLAKITGGEITSVRYHYLRFRLPDSYRQMIKSGIREDYSMGYADESGFRAGIARPFYFYDILQDQQTELRIFPFQIMDETLFLNKRLDTEETKLHVMKIISDVKKVGGVFISIWHNTSLPDDEEGHGAREVFEFMLKNQIYDNLS